MDELEQAATEWRSYAATNPYRPPPGTEIEPAGFMLGLCVGLMLATIGAWIVTGIMLQSIVDNLLRSLK